MFESADALAAIQQPLSSPTPLSRRRCPCSLDARKSKVVPQVLLCTKV